MPARRLAKSTVKKLVLDFASNLDKQQAPLTAELTRLLGQPLSDDATALFFEYQHDSFRLVSWWSSRAFEPIGKATRLLGDKRGATNARRSNTNPLYPKRLEDAFERFIARHEDDEDDLRSAYDRARTGLFKRWFVRCWKAASKSSKGGPPVHAFFSVHDTWFRTNLRTNERCSGDEIAKVVKMRPR
jgi:hypothetical protein